MLYITIKCSYISSLNTLAITGNTIVLFLYSSKNSFISHPYAWHLMCNFSAPFLIPYILAPLGPTFISSLQVSNFNLLP